MTDKTLIMSKQILAELDDGGELKNVPISIWSFFEEDIKYYSILIKIPNSPDDENDDVETEICGGCSKTFDLVKIEYDRAIDGVTLFLLIPSMFESLFGLSDDELIDE